MQLISAVQIPYFDLQRQHSLIKKELQNAMDEVMASGIFINGPKVEVFERLFSDFLGEGFTITVANGTDALELAFQVLDLMPGDEVIVPAFGWISGAMSVTRLGLIPVFVDVEIEYGNIDPELITKVITPKTKAILGIHMGGHPCRVEEIQKICNEFGLYFIEDCAQAVGASIDGRKVGLFGDVSIFSFYPTKNLGALGDAGCLVVKEEKRANRLKSLRDYGRTSRHTFSYLGRNSRMDELQAAVLIEKLTWLPAWQKKRKEIVEKYRQALSLKTSADMGVVHHRFYWKPNDRASILARLKESGIGFDTLESNLMESTPIFKKFHRVECPVARQLADEIVCLPLFPELFEHEIAHICQFLETHKI